MNALELVERIEAIRRLEAERDKLTGKMDDLVKELTEQLDRG